MSQIMYYDFVWIWNKTSYENNWKCLINAIFEMVPFDYVLLGMPLYSFTFPDADVSYSWCNAVFSWFPNPVSKNTIIGYEIVKGHET